MNSKEYIELSRAKENARAKAAEEEKAIKFEEAMTGIKSVAAKIEKQTRSERKQALGGAALAALGMIIVGGFMRMDGTVFYTFVGMVMIRCMMHFFRTFSDIKLMKQLQKDEFFQNQTQEAVMDFWNQLCEKYPTYVHDTENQEKPKNKSNTLFLGGGGNGPMPGVYWTMK